MYELIIAIIGCGCICVLLSLLYFFVVMQIHDIEQSIKKLIIEKLNSEVTNSVTKVVDEDVTNMTGNDVANCITNMTDGSNSSESEENEELSDVTSDSDVSGDTEQIPKLKKTLKEKYAEEDMLLKTLEDKIKFSEQVNHVKFIAIVCGTIDTHIVHRLTVFPDATLVRPLRYLKSAAPRLALPLPI